MKKALSLILSMAICAMLDVPAFAETLTNDAQLYTLSSEETANVEKVVNGFLDYSPEYSGSEFKIGNYIPTYTWDGAQFSVDTSAVRYPVYANGKIATFYTIIDPESGDSARQFGVEFANELNDFVSSGATEYFLVGYEGKVFAVSGGKVALLVDYGTADIDLESMKARIDALKDSKLKTDYEKFYETAKDAQAAAGNNSRTAKANTGKELTTADLKKSIANSGSSFDVNRDHENLHSLQILVSSDTLTLARADQYRYFAVTRLNQLPDKKICWAVAATRIGNYWTSISKTPQQVVQYIHGVNSEYGNIFDAQTALEDLYYLSPDYEYTGYTWDEVGDYIEGGYLLYGAFYNAALTTGHAVCVNGYYIDGSDGILIMESLGGTYKQLLANSSGTYVMNYTGLGNLSWRASLSVYNQ